jgi:hypothetical protein
MRLAPRFAGPKNFRSMAHGWVGPILPKNAPALARRRGVNFDLLVIFVLVLCKILQEDPKCPRTNFA